MHQNTFSLTLWPKSWRPRFHRQRFILTLPVSTSPKNTPCRVLTWVSSSVLCWHLARGPLQHHTCWRPEGRYRQAYAPSRRSSVTCGSMTKDWLPATHWVTLAPGRCPTETTEFNLNLAWQFTDVCSIRHLNIWLITAHSPLRQHFAVDQSSPWPLPPWCSSLDRRAFPRCHPMVWNLLSDLWFRDLDALPSILGQFLVSLSSHLYIAHIITLTFAINV